MRKNNSTGEGSGIPGWTMHGRNTQFPSPWELTQSHSSKTAPPGQRTWSCETQTQHKTMDVHVDVFSWTTGDMSLSHEHRIDIGGSGTVHEVSNPFVETLLRV